MIENPYDLLKVFYKIRKQENAIIPIGDVYIGDRSIIDSYILLSNITGKEELYCPKCGDGRKYEFRLDFDNSGRSRYAPPDTNNSLNTILSECKEDYDGDFEGFKKYVYKSIVLKRGRILITGKCLQCDNEVNIVIYNENDTVNMVKLFKNGGGVSTEHTPDSVRYYLDEAYKCKTMGAYTGAVAMYRTALENLLYDNGYTQNGLDKKIKVLEENKLNGEAKPWAIYIDGGILDKIKLLGNSAVHPNKGDIDKQQHLKDEELLICIDEVFKYILERIYEDEHKQKSLFSKLSMTNNIIRGK